MYDAILYSVINCPSHRAYLIKVNYGQQDEVNGENIIRSAEDKGEDLKDFLHYNKWTMI